jgi:hypothetical protein
MDKRSPDLLKPTLIAGLLFGFLGGVPFVNFINCACCALIIAAGFLASYLYSKECRKVGAEFRPGTGALVGLVAGAFYALMTTLVGTVASLAMGDFVATHLVDFFKQLPNMPADTVEQLDRMAEQAGTFSVGGLIVSFFGNVLFGAIFATVGGLIGGAVFKVERPAPPPPAPPPPPPFTPPPPPVPPPAFGGDVSGGPPA